MNGEYLTILEKEDEPPSDLQVPYVNAGFLLPTFAAFPSPPADPECLTSQNEASPPLPSSSVAPRMKIPLTIDCTPRCLLGSRELRGRQMGEDPDTWSALTHQLEERYTLNEPCKRCGFPKNELRLNQALKN